MKRNITRLTLFILCALLLLPILSASATEEEEIFIKVDGGEFSFDKSTGTIEYYFTYENEFTDLVIPEKLDGVTVTAIGNEVFHGYAELRSVTLPNGLKHIGESAFSGCDALETITIPDSVTSIGDYAFDRCYALESVKLGNGLTAIPEGMFCYCESLTDITFGANITSIGESAFYSCTSLSGLTLPGTLKTIGSMAFSNCERLANVPFSNQLESIDNLAFESCYALTDINLPDSVKTIGSAAFESCHALTTVKIPDGVNSIGDYAFASCSSVTSVEIGKGLASLGLDTFRCGSNLVSITVDPANKHFSADESGVLFNKDKTELLLCPGGFKGAYVIPDTTTAIADRAFVTCEGLTEITIGKNTKTIGNDAFLWSNLTTLIIPDSVTHIGNFAFEHCEELTEITLGSGVESIGKDAFLSCHKLASITVSKENKHYASDASGVLFSKADAELLLAPASLSVTYTIPDGVKTINEKAFHLATELTEVSIPQSVEVIEREAFAYCHLTSITIPEGVKRIEGSAFFYCTDAKSITLPDTLVSIGSDAFYSTAYYNNRSNWDEKILYIGNHLIESESTKPEIVVREGTLTIAYGAFLYAPHTSVTLPESLLVISEKAFYCCDLLTIHIPKNVTTIDAGAFDACFSLTAIEVDKDNKYFCNDESGVLYDKQKTTLLQIPNGYNGSYAIANGVKTIADFSFYYIEHLTRLTIPKSVTAIGRVAFSGFRGCDVYYTGSEADWNKIDIYEDSKPEFEGCVIFNYVPADQLSGEIPFSDVKKTDYFATPVLWASANKITSGVSAESFAPNAACTRAQIATFLWRAKGSPEPMYNDNPFVDVKQADYYYKAVMWAYEHGIIYGTSESTFSPNDPCTRGQVATLLQRCSYDSVDYEAENPFTDVSIDDYYYDGVLWAYENGITDGVGNGKFAPNAVCTRAQIVTFLFRALA